jgi:3,4-dehydroadipyl-CoA semialdehyde dehydrogenase
MQNVKDLKSYLGGQWVWGSGTPQNLYNPTTDEVVAQVNASGLDLRPALDFARKEGGSQLRAMTFAQRATLLESMSKTIHAKRDELIEIGRINAGNTRADAKFDIDGASQTLMYYANLGKTLEDFTLMTDGGAVESVGRGGRLGGVHILTPKTGLAVHINAFNFPAWGLAEKAACAILAGMPVLCKPATATAWLTQAIVEHLEPIMPKGVLSLLCGSAGHLLDCLEMQDVVAFTGSADTAHEIRKHPNVLAKGILVNVEADSLNAMILDPKAEDKTYDAFIKHVHTEMTQKAGQKCTAVRRILVQEEMVDQVIEDLSERLSKVVVGDPALDEVNMGPLSTRAQQKAALEGLAQLQTSSDLVWGGPEGKRVGVDAQQGAFVNATLLKARDLGATSVVHQVEVFAPVSTILPFKHVAHAIEQTTFGQGCLVNSIYGDDHKFLGQCMQSLAPFAGRLVVVDEQVADQALAPGLVTPQLLHGGPGRAGGGEELGGLRGMKLYQQRTAIQGNIPKLMRVLGIESKASF